MSPTPELLKIGDFAKLADTNLRTLRYYEELGLVHPATRSEGGFRYYRRTDVNRIQMIRDLQALGLPLDEIAKRIGERSERVSRAEFVARTRATLLAQDELLRARMRVIEEQREHVASALRKLTECESCAHTPGRANNFCEPCSTTGESLPRDLSALYQ